jgi:thymidylate synthase ThyX
MINAKILLDSVSSRGSRITTWVLTYPRFIHAEFMTHRVFSRNASSSRAIPVKKMLEDVKSNPAMPVFWGKNQAGMQAAEELDNTLKARRMVSQGLGELYIGDLTDLEYAKAIWLEGRNKAVKVVEKLTELGLHKQVANRMLEPWMHITVLATATEHENFFSLRAHKDAQPEFQNLAYQMLDLYQKSEPKVLMTDEWHVPFGDKIDNDRFFEVYASRAGELSTSNPELVKEMELMICSARCARISYLNFEGKDDYEADLVLAERLRASGHWSPFEHCAQALDTLDWSGNFKGWKQYRKFFNQENRSDGRVKRYNYSEDPRWAKTPSKPF